MSVFGWSRLTAISNALRMEGRWPYDQDTPEDAPLPEQAAEDRVSDDPVALWRFPVFQVLVILVIESQQPDCLSSMKKFPLSPTRLHQFQADPLGGPGTPQEALTPLELQAPGRSSPHY